MPSKPEADRQYHRRMAADHSALIDLLDSLYPATQLPKLNATDREIGAWLGQRELIQRLQILREEALRGTSGSLPRVLGG